jgi:TetR/AcrR family transcriptional regulator, lmrAB and yxaGH operons repressor
MTVVSKGERTRAKLVATTASLLQRQGYHGTGLNQIIADSGAPRGSLYFYFPGGKEELACAALAGAGAEWQERLEAVIDGAPDLGASVVAVCQALADALVASSYEHGCPLATVALEAATSSEAVRKTCAAHYAGWVEKIAARLARAGVAEEAARRHATFALSAIEGALLLCKVSRDVGPLLDVGEALRSLLAPPGSSQAGP